jgi:hypothetical protein
MGEGYSTVDGWIALLNQGGDITQIKEIRPNGLFDDLTSEECRVGVLRSEIWIRDFSGRFLWFF